MPQGTFHKKNKGPQLFGALQRSWWNHDQKKLVGFILIHSPNVVILQLLVQKLHRGPHTFGTIYMFFGFVSIVKPKNIIQSTD